MDVMLAVGFTIAALISIAGAIWILFDAGEETK